MSPSAPVTTIAAATNNAATGSSHWAPVSWTRASPITTVSEISASVRRWAASPSKAAEDVLRAFRASVRIATEPVIEPATTLSRIRQELETTERTAVRSLI
jgi:hypothetical protein